MEINKIEVILQPSLLVEAPEIILMPVGDVQHGAPGSDIEAFKRHIDWGMEHRAYFISMGDMVDIASPSERRKLANLDLHDSTKLMMEESAFVALKEIEEVLNGTEGRWFGFHRGHHYWVFADGYTTDQKLAARFRAPYLDWLALTTLTFPGTTLKCKVISTHGSGSSSSMIGPLNGQVKKLADDHPEADIVLVGHHSRKVGYPQDRIEEVRGSLQARRRILTLTGGFCRGYLVGQTTYVEEGLMSPLNQGAPIIFVRPMPKEQRLDLSLLT